MMIELLSPITDKREKSPLCTVAEVANKDLQKLNFLEHSSSPIKVKFTKQTTKTIAHQPSTSN